MLLWVFSVPKERAAVTAGTISGVWGHVTNKRFRRFAGYGKSAKISKLVQVCIACRFANTLHF